MQVSATRYVSSFALINSFTATSSPTSLPPSVPNKDATVSTRMRNTLDDGAPFYTVYTCCDGRWFSVACIEPKFYQIFLESFLAALPEESKTWTPTLEEQHQRGTWPKTRAFFERGFKMYDRDYWALVFKGMVKQVLTRKKLTYPQVKTRVRFRSLRPTRRPYLRPMTRLRPLIRTYPAPQLNHYQKSLLRRHQTRTRFVLGNIRRRYWRSCVSRGPRCRG